jgi:hypothetical protein
MSMGGAQSRGERAETVAFRRDNKSVGQTTRRSGPGTTLGQNQRDWYAAGTAPAMFQN